MEARVHVLGPVLIEGVDSVTEERHFAGRKAVLAFAYLMLERDRLIEAEELAPILWPGGPPTGWADELEGLLAGLRSLLDRSGLKGRDVIRSVRGGYQVQLGDVWLDDKAASDKIQEAEGSLDRGETDRARRAASVSKGIVNRPLLPGEEGPWIAKHRERLSGLQQAAADILERVEQKATVAKPIRVMKTFMFTDIEDSTKLIELLGDDSWTDLIRWHDIALRECFAAHDGEEVDHAGDGFLVAFDAQRNAIDCAVMIQRRLAEQRKTHGFAPPVRIGLHSAEATSEEGAYKGKSVHEAARIGGLASGGQIVVSRATVEGLTDVAVRDSRMVDLKGILDSVEVLTVDWDED